MSATVSFHASELAFEAEVSIDSGRRNVWYARFVIEDWHISSGCLHWGDIEFCKTALTALGFEPLDWVEKAWREAHRCLIERESTLYLWNAGSEGFASYAKEGWFVRATSS